MSQAPNEVFSVREYVRFSLRRPAYWILPALLCGGLAVAYVLLVPASWEASQAVVVRDEIATGGGNPGKFTRAEDMKTLQETILEVAKSRTTLRAVLESVGPPADWKEADWPSEKAIDGFSDAVKLVPPKGAEFGKTEVFYLKVQDKSRTRAVELADAAFHEMTFRFDQLRSRKAQGIISEIERSVSLAQADLDAATQHLATVEQEAGRDLPDLRMINESPSGDSELRKVVVELQADLRVQRPALALNEELIAVLQESQQNPAHLLTAPGRLLESQPSLKKLRDSLMETQTKTAQLIGTLSDEHPLVKASRITEQEILRQIKAENEVAMRGVEVDLRLSRQRIVSLEQQYQEAIIRLNRLAKVRAEYGNLVTQVRNRNEIVKTAELELSEARAELAGSRAGSLITAIDQPDTGSRPVGPGKTIVVLGASLSGVFLGLGILFLIQPVATVAAKPITRTIVTDEPNPYAALVDLATTAEMESTAAAIADAFVRPVNASQRNRVPTGPLNMKQALAKLTQSSF